MHHIKQWEVIKLYFCGELIIVNFESAKTDLFLIYVVALSVLSAELLPFKINDIYFSF